MSAIKIEEMILVIEKGTCEMSEIGLNDLSNVT